MKSDERSRKRRSRRQAKFLTGPIMRHVLVMTGTGSIGLMAVFIVDALNLQPPPAAQSTFTSSNTRHIANLVGR